VKITLNDLDRWGACDRQDGEKHSDAALRKLFPTGAATPLQVAKCNKLLPEDRVWVLLRTDVLGARLPAVVKAIVDFRVKRHCLYCGVPAVESWARIWLSGEDRSLRAAREAAAAAWAAAAAAWAAAAAAEVRAAAAAAASAARAERQRQLGIIEKALKEAKA
jgi:hypothetical protein